MERIDKINYYLDIAEVVSERGTCIRRNYGSVIVNNDKVVSTGYTGAPRGRENCCDNGECIRTKLNIRRGERYELCRSVHSEANAIINADWNSLLGADLYLCGVEKESGKYVENACCCSMCKRMVINAGISRVIVRDTKTEYRIINVSDWVKNDESLNGTKGY